MDINKKIVYFCGSIRAGREDQPIYQNLINHIETNHGIVLTHHIGEGKKDSMPPCEKNFTEKQIFERDMNWLKQCTHVVAECSTPSLGVGFELGVVFAMPVEKRPKILTLFRVDDNCKLKLSAMIAGCPYFINAEYKNIDEAKIAIDFFFSNNQVIC
jgi:hypothetical protein